MRHLVLLSLLAARAVSGAVVAEASFADGPEQYQDTPYFWLGNGPLTITVATPPVAGQTLALHWGSKQDDRSASVVINGVAVPVAAGGHDGFVWVRIRFRQARKRRLYHPAVAGRGGQGGVRGGGAVGW